MASIGTPTPVTITPNMPGLTFDTPTPVTPTAPVGVKAKSPTTNVSTTSNALPATQVAPRDLSGTYARDASGTIYNKNSQTKFSKPEDFFKDAGVSDFNNLKFDTAYTPTGKETVYGAPTTNTSFNLGDGTKYDVNGKPLATPTASAPVAPTPSSATVPITSTGLYSPPNQGTTGVSEGGIIGNLINMGNNETPEVTKARADLKSLEDSYATNNADILSRPEGLTQQTGQQGILASLFASKQNAAQNAITNALTSQGQRIGATEGAAGANAPITGVPYGTQTIQPSQPNGSTTSGAANLDSLIGTRQVPGQQQVEYFDKNTNQGFSTPQALADFVNKQLGTNTATAANVFDILKQQQSTQANGGALNPLNNVSSIAQQVINGQISPSQAYAMGGSVANWQGLLNQALQQASPGFDQSAAQAKYDANQTTQGSQAQIKAQYQSASQQANNLTTQFQDLLKTYGLNPSDFNAANGVLQTIAANTSDWRYKALQNYISDIVSTYAQVLSPGESTDALRQTATNLLDSTAKGTSLQAILAGLDQQAQAKIAGVQTPSTTGSSNSSVDSIINKYL